MRPLVYGMESVTFTAPCPCGHPRAVWTQQQDVSGRVEPEHLTIACWAGCDRPSSPPSCLPAPQRMGWLPEAWRLPRRVSA